MIKMSVLLHTLESSTLATMAAVVFDNFCYYVFSPTQYVPDYFKYSLTRLKYSVTALRHIKHGSWSPNIKI